MTFDFSTPAEKKAKQKAEKEQNLTAYEKAYRDREKKEQERYKKATDGNIWVCFCFHNDKEKQEFAKIMNAVDDFCFGDDLRELFTEKIGGQTKRVFSIGSIHGEKLNNPLDNAYYSKNNSLEDDCFAEAEAILQAFENRQKLDFYKNVFDSRFYITAIFTGGGDIQKFISDFGLKKFGEKYMDGSKVLELLR